ncbi:MAG TPA: hypothetical protein VHO25_05090 [Polyangiaceae bacterium]|nr:hypothetical protein [Polyangiaceae bacterium]
MRTRALLLIALGALARPAAAEVTGWLEVERDESAQACPAADALRASVERLLASPPSSDAALIRVTFRAEGSMLSARLARLGDEAGARELVDSHRDCETLAQAVSTTVALMLETRVTLPDPPKPAPPPAQRAVHPSTKLALPRNALGLQLSGGMGFEVIDGINPLIGAAAVFERESFQVTLGAAWMPSQRITLGPGHVEASIVTLTSRACLKLADATAVDLWGCTGFLAGLFRVKASGYTRDLHRSEPWLAVPLESSIAGPIQDSGELVINWRLGGTLLLPIQRQSYSVEGLGTALDPGKVQGLLWLGLEGLARW